MCDDMVVARPKEKKILRFAALLLLFFAGYYVYRAADLYFHQEKYVYHPEKIWTATPASEGLPYEDLTLQSSDGMRLSAWYIPAEQSKGSVLFLHGNARNMSADLDAIKMFHDLGYNVLTLDYRGYGKSEGRPDEEGTYRDAQAGWDWLVGVKGESPKRIVICGRSLGSAIAADLASKNASGALILEAAFTSMSNAAQGIYPYVPVKFLSRYRYDTLNKLKNVRCPVLIVHSREDELIPFRHAEQLYAAVSGRKDLLELGGLHKGGYQPTLEKYHEGVKRFLVEYSEIQMN